MSQSISFRQFLALSFFLFSMFLGAGNIIFAPPLGQAAGTNTWVAMSGFLITGVGLVLLAIMALSISGGSVEKLSGRVSPGFAVFFSILLFMTLGPIYVVPRTAAVVYEITVTPFLSENIVANYMQWALLVFSVLFIWATIYLSLEPKKFVKRIGNILTPIFLILLLVIVLVAYFDPIGDFREPSGPYIDFAFSKGFTQGYYTMDVLAAFVFGKIFLDAAHYAGIDAKHMTGLFVRSGIFAVVALALIQLSLAGMGASSASVLGVSNNGGEALTRIVDLLMGRLGVVMLATVIFLTGLTTAIACLASVAEYFSRIFPSLTYRAWVILLGLLSLVITNFGLTTILTFASPVLLFLYPIAITLIVLVFTNKWFGGRQAVYVGAVTGAAIMGVIDGLNDIKLLPASLADTLRQTLPLYDNGLGWIVVALAGAVLGLLASVLFKAGSQRYVNQHIG